MTTPLFIANRPFFPLEGKAWENYCQWARIPGLVEIVTLDSCLCPRLITDLQEEDWKHIVNEDFRLDYFYDLAYLQKRVQSHSRKSILGLYRNPATHIDDPPAPQNFAFMGYDLIEEATQISALTNCGGFPDVFRNDELNQFGLITAFERAAEVKRMLAKTHPEECHAQCELYAIWRLSENNSCQ